MPPTCWSATSGDAGKVFEEGQVEGVCRGPEGEEWCLQACSPQMPVSWLQHQPGSWTVAERVARRVRGGTEQWEGVGQGRCVLPWRVLLRRSGRTCLLSLLFCLPIDRFCGATGVLTSAKC